ncbi:unnamed protein product, partial [Callosobruchus maculatus]
IYVYLIDTFHKIYSHRVHTCISYKSLVYHELVCVYLNDPCDEIYNYTIHTCISYQSLLYHELIYVYLTSPKTSFVPHVPDSYFGPALKNC